MKVSSFPPSLSPLSFQANEATIAIVDGSGVLCDPAGLNQPELERLAHGRKTVAFFDVSLLGPQGGWGKKEELFFRT